MDSGERGAEQDSPVSDFVRSAKERSAQPERRVVEPLTRRKLFMAWLAWLPVGVFVGWALTIPLQIHGSNVRSAGDPWPVTPVHYILIVAALAVVVSLGLLRLWIWRRNARK